MFDMGECEDLGDIWGLADVIAALLYGGLKVDGSLPSPL